MVHSILLFYKYTFINNPHDVRQQQLLLCQQLGLKGRILIAQEGINATVGGTPENTARYKQAMQEHPLFADIDFKESFADGDCFPKLKVKVRTTIVNLGIDPAQLTAQEGGVHLTPTQTHELISTQKDLVIFDARNAFEAEIGKFKDAVVPNIEYFRELPTFIDAHQDMFKDKEVLMYCTGGIRCERASAYLKSKNIAKKVYQLEGGIHRYIEQFPDGHFRGKNYVFDGRIAVNANADILGNCIGCTVPCSEYTNCINVQCNAHCLLCSSCTEQLGQTCSIACRDKLNNNTVLARNTPAKTACALDCNPR
ncbi:MAG: rhodanese-related sulfurtransferase [Candidatus Babeliales bacterium]